MKKKPTVTRGTGNVFADLGYANAEEHQAKARLASQIAEILDERQMTQADAAAVLGIRQPKVSAILNGHFRGFSVYRLMEFIAALGRDVEIVTRRISRKSETKEVGHIVVR